MKKSFIIFLNLLLVMQVYSQSKITRISSTKDFQWKTSNEKFSTLKNGLEIDAEILINKPLQVIDGFGTCFNELGWASLSQLKPTERENIMSELFAPGKGANFTICRMPVGANDFSLDWYSYNETPGDFEMKNFSIAHDEKYLIPFIKNAQKYNPKLSLWASPWSPPIWMKYNKHYASKPIPQNVPEEMKKKIRDEWGMDFTGLSNGLQPDQEGFEGTDMFIQDEKYFKAYSLYFSKFIEEYRKKGIKIGMVMPQNEFNSAQVFPSCTWTAKGLSNFLTYLSPAMKSKNVEVFFGTMERANHLLVDTVLTDSRIGQNINGVGFQWAGKGAISAIHDKYPNLKLYQTEQECGNGYNDWKYAKYAWSLMKHYLSNGANAYMYWNTSLNDGGRSTWGWHQNSLISVDPGDHSYKYNYEYYLIKHLSHFVKPGARRLETKGQFSEVLAFQNPDKSIVIMVHNDNQEVKRVNFAITGKFFSPELEADSFATFFIK